MISFEEAHSFVLGSIETLRPVTRQIIDALGSVAAEEIVAHEAVPGFANSSMDGFAMRSSDTSHPPARLRVVATTLAGNAPAPRVDQSEAVRIMTGAALPAGADCVCRIEDVTVDDSRGEIVVSQVVAPGDCVRQPGEDIAVGDRLIAQGEVLNAPLLGVVASQGRDALLVYPRPRVGILSTGDELAGANVELGPGEIRDSNRPLLAGMLQASGFEVVDFGVARDDYDSTLALLEAAALTCDAVVSTGGVSVGDVDHVKTAILALGGSKARWMQVAIRPGKPFAFGVVGPRATPLFGLPGNPVSTRVSFELFVRPALRRLAGHRDLDRPRLRAVLDESMARSRDGKLHVVHVEVGVDRDARLRVERVARQGSHLLRGVAGANALVLLPDGAGAVVGESVSVLLLDELHVRETNS